MVPRGCRCPHGEGEGEGVCPTLQPQGPERVPRGRREGEGVGPQLHLHISHNKGGGTGEGERGTGEHDRTLTHHPPQSTEKYRTIEIKQTATHSNDSHDSHDNHDSEDSDDSDDSNDSANTHLKAVTPQPLNLAQWLLSQWLVPPHHHPDPGVIGEVTQSAGVTSRQCFQAQHP